ncbi:hypothetical protein [Cysteiniphilum sp. JM-1]|uniref:hypothetical protein n=1 Tax=Cysteiniphilum sp. JM-1 TaxID=2610891 RepID=UPI0012489BED|nr:hypothetical protein [Cysteiniphilum sp. JM-1]
MNYSQLMTELSDQHELKYTYQSKSWSSAEVFNNEVIYTKMQSNINNIYQYLFGSTLNIPFHKWQSANKQDLIKHQLLDKLFMQVFFFYSLILEWLNGAVKNEVDLDSVL